MQLPRTWIAPLTTTLLLAGCGGGDSGNGVDAANHVDAGRPDAGANVHAFPLVSVQGGIAYTAAVTIGGSQSFQLDVDTGSTTLGVAATVCSSCQVTPEYTPGTAAVDQQLTTSSQYGDGTGWNGEVFTDKVGLMGDPGEVAFRFASIQSSNGFFRGGNDDQGIIGMGSSALATPNTDSFIDKRKAAGLSTDFAFQFCTDAGKLWLGGYDPAFTASDMQYTPIASTPQNPFYNVNVTGSTIGGTSIGLTGASVADTGTSLMIVSTAIETKMINAIQASTGFKAMFPGSTISEQSCLSGAGLTDAQVDAALPPMVVTLPGKTGGSIMLSLPATKSYLMGMQGSYCFGVAAVDGLPTILGDTFLHAFITDFDLPNNQIGFATVAGCNTPAAHFESPTQPVKPPHWYIRGHRM